MIRDGELAPGARLAPERELAGRFGVSRTTLRDAIRELELLGYLEVRQGDGTVVRVPDAAALAAPFVGLLRGQPQLAEDLVAFRRMLEPELASLAASRCSRADAAALERSLARQERRVASGRGLQEEDLAFHRLVARTAGNATVLHVLHMLHSLLRELRLHLLAGTHPERDLAQHSAIARAIIDGDRDRARRSMLAHLDSVERNIVHGTVPTTDGRP